MEHLNIRTLGNTRVELNGMEPLWHAQGARAFFFYLLTFPQGCTRNQMIEEVWEDNVNTQSKNRFRVTIFRLRGALHDPESVQEDYGRYHLTENILQSSDVHRFQKGLMAARHTFDHQLQQQHLEAALEQYQGDYLPDVQQNWAHHTREQLKTQYLQGLLHLAFLSCEKMQCPAAIDALQHALTLDPYLGEQHHQDLMRCLTLVYGKVEAINHHRHFLHFLKDDVQDTPLPETLQLAEDIKRGVKLEAHQIGETGWGDREVCPLRPLCGLMTPSTILKTPGR